MSTDVTVALDDGVLGFYCAHYYAHNTEYAHGIFPLGLKGSDMALVAVLLSLHIDVCVCPVIKDYGHEASDDNSPLFGDAMHTVIDVNDYDVRDSIREKILEKWPSGSHKDEVTWVNDPLHTNDALKVLVHARKNSIMTVKSSVVILAHFPNWHTRTFGVQTPESESEEA